MYKFPENILPGYVVPLHRSLTEKILLGGAPRNYVILVSTVAAIFGLALHLYILGTGIWLTGHAFGVYAARKDPQFLEVFVRHLKHKGELEC